MYYQQNPINGTIQQQTFTNSNYNNQNQFEHYNPTNYNESQNDFYNLSGTNNYNETQKDFYNLSTPSYVTPS